VAVVLGAPLISFASAVALVAAPATAVAIGLVFKTSTLGYLPSASSHKCEKRFGILTAGTSVEVPFVVLGASYTVAKTPSLGALVLIVFRSLEALGTSETTAAEEDSAFTSSILGQTHVSIPFFCKYEMRLGSLTGWIAVVTAVLVTS
jgi:hypothetical protein